VPNAGHGLEQIHGEGKKDRVRVLSTLSAYGRKMTNGGVMPKITWKHDDHGDKLRIAVASDVAPKSARLWVADAATRDFRKSRWAEQAMKMEKNSATGEVDRPAEGWRSFVAEFEFEEGGQSFYLSTQLRMVEANRMSR
jgi:RPA family protein